MKKLLFILMLIPVCDAYGTHTDSFPRLIIEKHTVSVYTASDTVATNASYESMSQLHTTLQDHCSSHLDSVLRVVIKGVQDFFTQVDSSGLLNLYRLVRNATEIWISGCNVNSSHLSIFSELLGKDDLPTTNLRIIDLTQSTISPAARLLLSTQYCEPGGIEIRYKSLFSFW